MGFEVAAHTATFHGVDLHDRQAVIRDRSARRAGAWLALMGDLRGYLGTGPGNGQIHLDVSAVHQLLADLVPRDRPSTDRAMSAKPDERHLGGTPHGACAALVQAAEWNFAKFARLARSEKVYVPIDTLSRDELSDRPDLAAAKLAGARLAPAPAELTEKTLDRYRDVVRVCTAAKMEPHRARRVRARDDAGHVLTREPSVPR